MVADLRPITLLPLPGKIVERLIHDKLYPYLENNGIMAKTQNGFCKNHGTPDTIFKLISHITDNLNNHQDTLAIFIDLKKAFDTLDYNILFKEIDKLNISQNLKFLFHLYINDLPKIVTSKILLYADDSVIFDSSNDEPALYKQLQADLNLINYWCDQHKLTINVKKTKAVMFSNRKDTVHRCISLKNDYVEHVSVFKYLGIHLDSRLGFQSQCKETYKLSSFKLLMLKRICPFINEDTALIITKSMLLPYLDMGNMYFTSLT